MTDAYTCGADFRRKTVSARAGPVADASLRRSFYMRIIWIW